jgi:hypothetical protein
VQRNVFKVYKLESQDDLGLSTILLAAKPRLSSLWSVTGCQMWQAVPFRPFSNAVVILSSFDYVHHYQLFPSGSIIGLENAI